NSPEFLRLASSGAIKTGEKIAAGVPSTLATQILGKGAAIGGGEAVGNAMFPDQVGASGEAPMGLPSPSTIPGLPGMGGLGDTAGNPGMAAAGGGEEDQLRQVLASIMFSK